ncbi:MAG: hydantoinase B/oxoprolinase family protein [Hyphomicrobiales bacterium]|nr:MAG: hydantoinase B/oxoprolinase family protein [Hyphomicrobiales bacterium]
MPDFVRDFDQQRFEELYNNDRFTASVLSSRMRYIVEHMCAGLLNNAFSPILRDWYDFSATIVGPPEMQYPMSTVSNSMSAFVGHMAEAVRATVEEYGPEDLQPGDVLIANDPYRLGNHVNDMCFIRPIFHEGRIVAFVSMKAHQLDLGGIVPAGFSAAIRNVFEGGLVIPPTLLFSHDRAVKSTFRIIFDNSRFGGLLLPDMMSIYQQLLLGERLIVESLERYGTAALHGAMRYSCDVSADAMREAIRTKVPDGIYEGSGLIDADGVDDTLEYKIVVRIAKYGENIEVDLSGTSEQARTCINAGPLDTKTAVVVALKMLLDQKTPLTSGAARNIDLVVPPGTICSATPPDGAIFMYFVASIAVFCAVYDALQPVLGAEGVGGDHGASTIHNGSGVRADGTPWVTVAQCGGEHGPWGATKVGDGDSYQVVPIGNNLDPATESIEADVPVVLLRKDYAIDSAGAGFNRGGAAVVKDVLWLTEAEHWLAPSRSKRPTGIGANGGDGGTAEAVWLFPPEVYNATSTAGLLGLDETTYSASVPVAGVLDPQTKVLDPEGAFFYHGSEPVWKTRAHSVFRYITGGGGGWGDPLDRSVERVLHDVRDEYISIREAFDRYGVVITGDPIADPEGLIVDMAGTASRRGELAATPLAQANT